MRKNSHFSRQPLYGQVIKLLDKSKILQFSHEKGGETIRRKARIITYCDVRKRKLIALLTNDMESDPEEIISIYRQRWEIELLFKQMKQNFR